MVKYKKVSLKNLQVTSLKQPKNTFSYSDLVVPILLLLINITFFETTKGE